MCRELLMPILLPNCPKSQGTAWAAADCGKGCPEGQKEAEALEILANITAACQRLTL